ncbi:MAG: ATP-binding protein [Chloroflexi bacterium]|nr:ATP-binding protein [Chloroflexota bacterium]
MRGDGDELVLHLVDLFAEGNVSNAVDHTDGVPSAIPKEATTGGEIRVSLHREADESVVTVADQGIGISQADLDRLFERFYRAKTAISLGLKGSGLGLYICKAIVEAHGGRIWVESAEGIGSRFSFSLPLT